MIPTIVLLEHERHVRENQDLHQDDAIRGQAVAFTTGRMFPNPVHNLDAAQAAKHYAQELRRRLETAGAIVLATPGVWPDDLVERAIHRRKPFDNAGRGYRDALIWYSAMELIDTLDGGDVVQFICVTDNIADFGDEKGNLHPDLRDELVAGRSDIDFSACLTRTVNEVWSEHLTWIAPRNPELKKLARAELVKLT